MDETGTVDTNVNQLGDIQQQEKLDMSGVSDDVLKVHGVMPGTKKEGITRRFYMKIAIAYLTGYVATTN